MKLDIIDDRTKSVEQEMKDMKASMEFVHAELADLKKESEKRKKDLEVKRRLQTLEESNALLNNRVIDLQATSMRNNLLFYNIKESVEENMKDLIHKLLEEKLGIENSKSTIKIDRGHRMGKPRAIVVKFNYYPDKEAILQNARKLRGTDIAISEQFPEEIVKIRKKLYPIFKQARAQKKKVKLVRDKLIIDGQTLYWSNLNLRSHISKQAFYFSLSINSQKYIVTFITYIDNYSWHKMI